MAKPGGPPEAVKGIGQTPKAMPEGGRAIMRQRARLWFAGGLFLATLQIALTGFLGFRPTDAIGLAVGLVLMLAAVPILWRGSRPISEVIMTEEGFIDRQSGIGLIAWADILDCEVLRLRRHGAERTFLALHLRDHADYAARRGRWKRIATRFAVPDIEGALVLDPRFLDQTAEALGDAVTERMNALRKPGGRSSGPQRARGWPYDR